MSHDILRLGVGIRTLMKVLDRRHLFPGFRELDSVTNKTNPAINTVDPG